MNPPKPNRRKMGAKKLEPIDWREFANDAVLNGNMSTLYQRPASEDPSAYASTEALVEIDKRANRAGQGGNVLDFAARGIDRPTVGPVPTVGGEHQGSELTGPTVGQVPTVGLKNNSAREASLQPAPPVSVAPTVGMEPTVGEIPTVGVIDDSLKKKIKAIKDVQDALTLAGHILYKAMYGAPDGARSKACTKGYRQLAAETRLDKDTVRDLIGDLKEKGIIREIKSYDPDIRLSKTYEVLSYKAILQMWRDADLQFVTAGRKRPLFCTAMGAPVEFRPTVGPGPTVGRRVESPGDKPTVGLDEFAGPAEPQPERHPAAELIGAMQQITGSPVDQEAADRLIANCRAEAPDCTLEEIVEFAWSKAFLCRSGKIESPIGFLITQVPKHFQGEAFQAYRQNKRKELEAAAASATRAQERIQEAEREIADMEEKQRVRGEIAERHRSGQGIDLKAVLQDSEADEVLKEWAQRMLKLGQRYQESYG